MLYTEESARANVRNRDGKRVFYLGKGDTLTSAARDFLNRERIVILPAQKPQEYALLGGGFCREKPEHMTHLDGNTLVPKTHPRIVLRGRVDSLEAVLLLCQLNVPNFSKELGEILAFVRHLLRCEVMDEAVKPQTLLGLTEEELRRHSHFPQDYYGQPHFMPQAGDGAAILHLNLARTAARETELAAVAAFTDRDGCLLRTDLIQAWNRVSSALYLLMIQEKRSSVSQPL